MPPRTLSQLFHKLPMADEKSCQAEIQERLRKADIPFQREARLDNSAIIDFLLTGDNTGIEVKLKGYSRAAILRQIERYAQFDRISSIILVSGIAIRLPDRINNKPATLVSIGASWL